MNTVTSKFSSEYRIKSSKFLGYLCPSSTINEATDHLNVIRKHHPDATHHCYAYILRPDEPVEFSSDDGEPSGSAGLPILHALKSFEIMNSILIVVRYYGGTKLGKKGLIDAYRSTSEKVIENASLKKLIPVKTYQIEYPYSQQSLIDTWKNTFTWIELESTYMETVKLTVGCPIEESRLFEKQVSSSLHQLIDFQDTGKSFHIKN